MKFSILATIPLVAAAPLDGPSPNLMTFTGMAARKAAFMRAGGSLHYMAHAITQSPILELNTINAPKRGNKARFGLFQLSWKVLTQSGVTEFAGMSQEQYKLGHKLDTDLVADIAAFDALYKHLSEPGLINEMVLSNGDKSSVMDSTGTYMRYVAAIEACLEQHQNDDVACFL